MLAFVACERPAENSDQGMYSVGLVIIVALVCDKVQIRVLSFEA